MSATEIEKEPDFYGVLERVTITANTAVLRFYDFRFPEVPGDKTVFVVTFRDPAFQKADIDALIGPEIELTVSPGRLVVDRIFEGTSVNLDAKSVTARMEAHDLEDYARRVKTLDEAIERLNSALVEQRRINERATSVAREHLRRAEIKAEASDSLKERQVAAMAVLERVLRELDPES